MSGISNDGIILDCARKLNENPPRLAELIRCLGSYVADVSSIQFPCLVDNHTGFRDNSEAFHVIACEDGVPDTDQQLLDYEEQRMMCQQLNYYLMDFAQSLEAVAQILRHRRGGHDIIEMHVMFGDIRMDLEKFGYYNRARISDLFYVSRTGRPGVHAGGMCFDLERLMVSLATSFVNSLDDSIRIVFELRTTHASYASFQQDQELKRQLVDLMAAHVSMSWKTRSPEARRGFDRKSLNVEVLQEMCDKQVDSEARLCAVRERDADVQRVGRLRDLVLFCATVKFELLRVLLESHRQQLIQLLEHPPPVFKKNDVVGKNFKWDGLLQILVVHQADDLLMVHVFRWARGVFLSEAITDALMANLDAIVASMMAQQVSESGFLPTLNRLIARPGTQFVPLPTWCRLPIGSEQSRLKKQLKELVQNGELTSMHASLNDGVLRMPADTERRIRLVSCIMELAANEKTAAIFFSQGIFLAEFVRRVVITQRETAEFAIGLIETTAASTELGRNYLNACRRVESFRGTGLENSIREAGLHLSRFSADEIYAIVSYMGQSHSRDIFSHARDSMLYKCPSRFFELIPRVLKVFLPPLFKMRTVSGVPNLRPCSVLEDSLRSIPGVMKWVEGSGEQNLHGQEFCLSLPDAKRGLGSAYKLILEIAEKRTGLVVKRRVGSKKMLFFNGADLERLLAGDGGSFETHIKEVDMTDASITN